MKLWYEVSNIEVPNVKVRDIMIKPPTTVFKKTNVSEAARTMRRNDFGQLPVVDSKDDLTAMLFDLDADLYTGQEVKTRNLDGCIRCSIAL